MAYVQDTLKLDNGGSVFLGLSSTSIRVGDKLKVTPHFRGAEKEDYLCNYVWNLEGSWEKGDFDSTIEHVGHTIPQYTWEFEPKRPGRYRIAVDIEDSNRRFLGNIERWIIVAGKNSFMRPPVPPRTLPRRFSPMTCQ